MNAFQSKADNELLRFLQAGEARAFDEIYHRYAALLFRYVSEKIYEREECEEIVQEAFVWLWTRRGSLHHVTELRAYLYGIVKHKVFNYIRHNIIKREYAQYFKYFGSTIDNSNQEQSDLADLMEILEASIAQLPDRCQVAFRLSRIENKPIAEIAEIMGISTRTVENYITQALKHLRENTKDFYRPDPENDTQ